MVDGWVYNLVAFNSIGQLLIGVFKFFSMYEKQLDDYAVVINKVCQES